MSQTYHPWFNQPKNIRWRLQVAKLVNTQSLLHNETSGMDTRTTSSVTVTKVKKVFLLSQLKL
jgi:hypothetical protein